MQPFKHDKIKSGDYTKKEKRMQQEKFPIACQVKRLDTIENLSTPLPYGVGITLKNCRCLGV
jgi:hypothetical protein